MEAIHKGPTIVWFHLHEVFRIGKSIAAGSSGYLAMGETVGYWKGDG